MSTDAGDSGLEAAGAGGAAAGQPSPPDPSAADTAAGTPAAGQPSAPDRPAADTGAGTPADAPAADGPAAAKADLRKAAGAAEGPAAPPAAGRGLESAARARGLKVHHLRPAPGAHRDKTRVGRGQGSKGKTAGRGTKGSKARKQIPARFEGGQMPLHMRVPKLKGFTNRFRVEYQVVNLSRLAELYPTGGRVGPDELAAAGAVRAGWPVKVLGDGEIATAVEVSAHAFSASAREKIVAAGGSVTVV